MRSISRTCLALAVSVALSGCLGTMVQSPAAASSPFSTTQVHLLAAPTHVDARMCEYGLAETFTYVPIWGVAVGILTFGILVPMTTVYSCIPAPIR